jgi:hypothetical protein
MPIIRVESAWNISNENFTFPSTALVDGNCYCPLTQPIVFHTHYERFIDPPSLLIYLGNVLLTGPTFAFHHKWIENDS